MEDPGPLPTIFGLLGVLFVLLGLLGLGVGLISLVVPLRLFLVTSRKQALGVVFVSIALMVSAGFLLPDSQSSPLTSNRRQKRHRPRSRPTNQS